MKVTPELVHSKVVLFQRKNPLSFVSVKWLAFDIMKHRKQIGKGLLGHPHLLSSILRKHLTAIGHK